MPSDGMCITVFMTCHVYSADQLYALSCDDQPPPQWVW